MCLFDLDATYSQDKLSNKIMFGTDYFGIGSGFEFVEEYIDTIKRLFGNSNLDKMLFKNCLNAYPKIEQILKKYYSNHDTNECKKML